MLLHLGTLMLTNHDGRRIAMGIIGVFPLHALYPLMKRWTWWPQAWLGRCLFMTMT